VAPGKRKEAGSFFAMQFAERMPAYFLHQEKKSRREIVDCHFL